MEDDRTRGGKTRAKDTSKMRAGEETDRAMWRRQICSHTDDPI